MCGLLLTFSSDTHDRRRSWNRALNRISARGPDARGETTVSGITFGHTRLSIIGLGSEGAQPMESDPDHVLVFNGEIYNFRELASSLGIDALSDTQVLYEIGRRQEWDTWVHRLRGMFAFAHYDRRRQVLTIARDPFGIKPLFLRTHADGEISIASTVAALASLQGPLEPDFTHLAGFLALGLFPAGTSAFRGIEKVAPGTVITLHRGNAGWTRQQFPVLGNEWPTLSAAEALTDSVAAHLVADVEVGVLLSGGVDSTLLAAMASRAQPGVRTFCLTNPDDPEIDEGRYAEHNSRLLGTTHLEIPVSPSTLADRAAPLIGTIGEPFADAAFLPLSALAEEVAQHVKVALAGEGADELFGGYRRYDVERVLDARGFGSAIRAAGRAARLKDRFPTPVSQRARALHASAIPHPADRHVALMSSHWSVINGFFPTGATAHSQFLSAWSATANDPWALNQPPNRAFDTRVWLPNVFLEKSDRASMHHSLELRTPYLDPVVAQSMQGFRPRNTLKKPLREELVRLLPGVMLPPRKKGLAVNLPSLITDHYAELIRETIFGQDSVISSMGMEDPEDFHYAALASPGLGFKVAMLGLWQERWLTA